MTTQNSVVPTQNPTSFQEVLSLLEVQLPAKGFAKLRSTLNLYVLKRFTFRGSAKTKLQDYPCHILLRDFIEQAPGYFTEEIEQAIKAGKNPKTLANDRSNFKKMMDFLLAQPWYSKVAVLQPIPKRAPRLSAGVNLIEQRQGRRSFAANPYALKESELTDKLEQQLTRLHHFATTKHLPARKGPRIGGISWKHYRQSILEYLGWLKNEVGFSLEDLDITLMADKPSLEDYTNWHLQVRGNGYRRVNFICGVALLIAKCFYGQKSQKLRFADCPPVDDIRSLQAQYTPHIKDDRRTTSPKAFDEKLLELEQCWECVAYLRRCCAERTHVGMKRSLAAVIDAWQDYLIIALLTYTPVRQREIRSLELSGNLHRQADGWWVKLKPEDHKTGAKTGKSREYPLFSGSMKEQLTQDLDYYIEHVRPLAQLEHQYLFFMKGGPCRNVRGKPISDEKVLTKSVPRLMFRVSALLFEKHRAKAPSPHDFRRIFCTWLYTYGTGYEQEVYAELMGHSVQEARRTYAQVKSSRITMQADEAFNSVLNRQRQIMAKFG
ncbi:tyrosine-type recombinase/integrase [Phormidium tenue FACHB-886]|nr:tyrosine-type recombinase/integrase [Phormidium tenue FACHB-886]